jgi:hypothetical protein
MRIVRLFVSVLLLCALVVPPIAAQESAPDSPPVLLFPFVPNGEHYGDTGPWYGTLVLQNPESVPLTVELRTAGGQRLRTVTVDPHAHAIVLPSQLFTGACRQYPATVRVHELDGIDRIRLPTAALAVDRIEIAGFQEGIDFRWGALADEVWIDWSLPGWEPTAPYTVLVIDCPDGQPVALHLVAPTDALQGDAASCVALTRAIELSAVKGARDGADSVPLPKGIGPITAVEVRYGPRYWASLGLADPTALDTSSRWQATVSGGAVTIQWGAASNDDDGGIPTGARYSVIVHAQEAACRQPRVAAMLLLTSGAPASSTGSLSGATIASSLPAVAPARAGVTVVPFVQRNNGWTTVLHLAHTSERSCPVQVELYGRRGDLAWSGSQTLESGQVWHLDLRTLTLPSDFTGSAWIRSSCGPLAFADRLKPSHRLAVSTVAVDPAEPARNLVLPLVYANHSGWNTGIALTNLANSAVTVDLAYRDAAGTILRSERHTLRPREHEVFYRPDLYPGSPPPGFRELAALSVTADGPVALIGDAVKYQAGSGKALTLPALVPLDPGISLLFPLATTDLPPELGDATGLTIANAATAPAPTTVELWSLGAPVPMRFELPIPAQGFAVLYLPEQVRVTSRFTGTAIVSAATGRLVASGTQVNATVLADGATGTPLAPGWSVPVLGTSLLPTWDATGPGLDVAASAAGLPNTPLLLEISDETADLDSDPACTSPSSLRVSGTGTLAVSLYTCALDPVQPPTVRVRLWWDRGPLVGALDSGDELLVERVVALPR